MVNTCAVVHCKTGYTKRQNKVDVVSEKQPLFSFPVKKTELNKQWIKFVNRKDWAPSKHSGICAKHFEKKYLKVGCRTTLLWDLNPIPTLYSKVDAIPLSVLPVPSTSRKPPTRTTALQDELATFKDQDKIDNFFSLNEALCPENYIFQINNQKAVFYKIETSSGYDIPTVTEAIVVDPAMHVKLFFKGVPVPLPHWFTNSCGCKLTKKSMLENFPAYIRSFSENKADEKSYDIMDELSNIRFKKPDGAPKFSSKLLRFALILRYTSVAAYKLMLKHFPLPCLSLLNKLGSGGVEPLKAAKLLLEEKKTDQDVVLLIDEMYLQKEVQYHQGQLFGRDQDDQFYKGLMTFMIVGLRKNIPFVVKAVPESKVEGHWLSNQIDECLESLHETGFQVRAVITDNHPCNVAAFADLCSKYRHGDTVNAIIHPSKPQRTIYLFFDSVHLLKNIRNNLLNCKRLIFPEFESEFIYLPAGEITWKLLHEVFEKDQLLQANLRKAHKLTYKALHPGNNKQSVPLALAIFDSTTSAGLDSYFPERKDAVSFLKLVNLWWTMSNSKMKLNNNFHVGDAARTNDGKPEFLRKLAEWVNNWATLQPPGTEKYTLSKQTSSALAVSLACTASLIEDLLGEGYSYVLTARFQTDPLELRFSKYRGMSGGRFLVGLREVLTSERILTIKTLLKESFLPWQEDIQPKNNFEQFFFKFTQEVEALLPELQDCFLEKDSSEVATVIAGYIAKKMFEKKHCLECNTLLILSEGDQRNLDNFDYLLTLSRGGLTLPSTNLNQYVNKSFAMLDVAYQLIHNREVPERLVAEKLLKFNDVPVTFLCEKHVEGVKFVNRTICNVFFNNAQKIFGDKIQKDGLMQFKQRQRKRRFDECS